MLSNHKLLLCQDKRAGSITNTNLRSRLVGDKPRAYVIDALCFVGEGFMPSRSILLQTHHVYNVCAFGRRFCTVLSGAYNPAKHHSKIAQRRAGGGAYNPAKHHSKIAQRRAGGGSYKAAKHHCKIAQRRAGGGAYNPAKHHCKIAQRRAGGGAYKAAKHHCKIAQRRAGGGSYKAAKHHSKIAQRRAGGPQSCYYAWLRARSPRLLNQQEHFFSSKVLNNLSYEKKRRISGGPLRCDCR